MKTAAVIPCRFQSSRFEGKPLATIGGKPMMWHVYQQVAKAASIDVAYIATDNADIGKACDELGMKWIMTSDLHLTGTDRVAECARMLDVDVIVNVVHLQANVCANMQSGYNFTGRQRCLLPCYVYRWHACQCGT